ncbi:MAG: hypothetical protein J0M16_05770, partial [Gammaproteobacteria bacterium]|nr:hypothetical protein [Gammaproteobacteria bacterium]
MNSRRLPAILLAALPVVLAPAGAHGYSGVADVTLSWGGNGSALNWSALSQNALPAVSNATRFSTLAGSNYTTWFNSDFATASNYGPDPDDNCLSLLPGYDGIELRQYGCRQSDSTSANPPVFHRVPATDPGPSAAAIGQLFFTDTTLTGTLTVVATTDESTLAGASAFNVRSLDISAFGNVWYGVSTGATLTVDLTGDFSASVWEITGGTVRLSDPGFQCQQGGIGGGAAGILCVASSTLPGTYSNDGSHLGFGSDADGGGAGTAMSEVLVRDTSGNLVASLGGVLATISIGSGGQMVTDFGEYRAGAASSSGAVGFACPGQIRWDGSRVVCGTLTAGALAITGTATPVDTEPDAYGFASVTDVALSTLTTSGAATITGIAAPARITVAGGQYSIGCTATYTSAAGNIPDGSQVCVRHTSAAVPGTNTVTTLTVGGVAATFTSTTIPADTTPDAFSFADVTGVDPSTAVVSGSVTIAGINAAAPVSVAGGEYSLGCGGVFTAVAGSVAPGQGVCVRHTSAAGALADTVTTLTVGGVSATFTSTTAAAAPDTTPDAFAFADQADVALSATITSAPVTISGIDSPATVTVAGGTFAVGCAGPYGSASATVTSGQTICVRHTSAATNSTAVTTTLTVGGVADGFTSTTLAALPPDTTPDAFAFTDQTGVLVSTVTVSAPVTITGLTGAATVTVTGGEYALGCAGSFVATPGSVNNGQTVCVRHTSAATAGAVTSTTLTVGGVSDTFSSTTAAAPPPDTTPDAFSFAAQAGVALSTPVTSAPVTITGIDAPAAVAVTGGQYSVGCTGSFGSGSGTVSNNQTVCVRHTSAAANSTGTTTTLTVGGVAGS